MGSLQKILEKYHMEKWFQRDNLIILVLVGILLVVIALPTKESVKEEEDFSLAENRKVESASENSEEELDGSYDDLYEYTVYLENKLEHILSEMSGVGAVSVMITLEASEEQVVEKDEALVRNNTTENDSQGGSRMVYQTDSGQETVYAKEGSVESPYVTKTLLPKIAGVVGVAEGAGTGNVSKNITEIAEALFDIEAHKIKVVAMD